MYEGDKYEQKLYLKTINLVNTSSKKR